MPSQTPSSSVQEVSLFGSQRNRSNEEQELQEVNKLPLREPDSLSVNALRREDEEEEEEEERTTDTRFQQMIETALEDENTIGQEAWGPGENVQQMETDEPEQNIVKEVREEEVREE